MQGHKYPGARSHAAYLHQEMHWLPLRPAMKYTIDTGKKPLTCPACQDSFVINYHSACFDETSPALVAYGMLLRHVWPNHHGL